MSEFFLNYGSWRKYVRLCNVPIGMRKWCNKINHYDRHMHWDMTRYLYGFKF